MEHKLRFTDLTDPDIKPYKALCSAVILSAINDLIGKGAKSEVRNLRIMALDFFRGDNPVFQFYARALDYEPEWLANKILSSLRDRKLANFKKYLPGAKL